MAVTDMTQLRKEVEGVAARTNFSRASLIPILRQVKEKYRELDSDTMQIIADVLQIHPVEVHAVSTFYSFVPPEAQGAFVFRLCRTYSCELSGKNEVAAQLQQELGIDFGEMTGDGAFSLEWANCMGMCDQGPAMLVNEEIYTKLTPAKVSTVVADYRKRQQDPAAAPSAGGAS